MSLKQPKTILIVDDHAMFAETLGQYLRTVFVNDEVKVVTSAERARQEASMRPIDVVLLDLEMADCTGLTPLAHFSTL